MRNWLLVLLFVATLGGCSGTQLAPEVAKALDIAECQTEAVRALVPHVETADAVVAAARVGDTRRAIALLLGLGLTPEKIAEIAKSFAACMPDAPAEPGAEAPALTDA